MRESKHRARLEARIAKALKEEPEKASKIIEERFFMQHGDRYAIERLRKLLGGAK